jgi:hypothetical protein
MRSAIWSTSGIEDSRDSSNTCAHLTYATTRVSAQRARSERFWRWSFYITMTITSP